MFLFYYKPREKKKSLQMLQIFYSLTHSCIRVSLCLDISLWCKVPCKITHTPWTFSCHITPTNYKKHKPQNPQSILVGLYQTDQNKNYIVVKLINKIRSDVSNREHSCWHARGYLWSKINTAQPSEHILPILKHSDSSFILIFSRETESGKWLCKNG